MNIEGKIIAVSDQVALANGTFHAVCDLIVNDKMLTQIEAIPTKSVWTGKLTSGTYELHVAGPLPSINQNSLGQP